MNIPNKNTGSTLSVDYLNITMRPLTDETPLDIDVILGILDGWFGDDTRDGYGFRGYKFSKSWPVSHVIFAWGGDFQRGTAHVSIPGASASSLPCSIRDAMIVLSKVCVPVITRIDIAIDIPTFDPFWTVYDNLWEYLVSKRVENVDRHLNERRGQRETGTIYLGHASSERRLRIYTKHLKTPERPKVTRFELQLSGTYAAIAQSQLWFDGLTLNQVALSYFKNFFIIGAFVDLGSVWVDVKRPRLERVRNTLAWLFVCAGAIADVLDAFGYETLCDIVELGKRKRGLPPCDNMGVQLELLNKVMQELEYQSVFLSDVG